MTTKLTYTVADLVAATGLSRSHWNRVIKSGDLPARRTGRDADGEPAGSYVVFAQDVEAYLEGLAEA